MSTVLIVEDDFAILFVAESTLRLAGPVSTTGGAIC